MKKKYSVITILILIIIVCVYSYWSVNNNIKKINDKLEQQDYQIVSIEIKFFDLGPFDWYEKTNSDRIYKIIYIDKENNKKTAWLKTGLWKYSWKNADGSEIM